MSNTRIETVYGSFGCWAKYYYTYIVKEPRQFGAAATLGNIVHSTLEERLQPNEKFTLEQLMEEFEAQVPKWDPDDQVGQELIEVGKQILTEFADRHQDDEIPIHSKEMPFSIVVGSALINGFIDRVDEYDDRIVITDYKTGKHEVSKKGAPKNLQLGIYALAADKIFGGKPVTANLYYLRSGAQKGHTFSRSDLDEVESRLLEITAEIVNKRHFHTTSNKRICSWCDFNNGVCSTGTARASRVEIRR